MKYFILLALLFRYFPGNAQHFEKPGNGIRVKTFYHQQGIDFNISETDTSGHIYHLFYDTVTNGFNFGKEFIIVRLQIFDGISWLFSKPIQLYSNHDVIAPRVLDLQWHNNALYLAGSFDSSENNLGGGLIKFENRSWQTAGIKLFNTNNTPLLINRLYAFNKTLLITGDFDSIPSYRTNSIAFNNGSVWQPIGNLNYIGLNGINNYNNTYFEVSNDSLYVFKKNNNGADTIVIGNSRIFKTGVFRGNHFETIQSPANRISTLLSYQGKLAALELSPLFYTRYLSIKTGNSWQRFTFPDSFYSINYIGGIEANNKLYLIVQHPAPVMIDIYEFNGSIIRKKQSWKITDSYINYNIAKAKNELILGGNFSRISNAYYNDSFHNIAKIAFNDIAFVTGITFIDANNDGLKQINESALPYCTINTAGMKYSTKSNHNGVYSIALPLSQAFILNAYNNSGYVSSFNFNFTGAADSIYKKDIGFTDNNLNDLSINLFGKTANKAKQGFKVSYVIEVRNLNNSSANTNININLPKGFTNLVPDNFNLLNQSGKGFLFNCTLNDHSLKVYTFSCIYTVDSFTIGERIKLSAEIQRNDNRADNNTDTFYQIIVSAYDPNIKQASPGEIISKNNDIRYTIYYQNEGNDYATNVTIVDTISEIFNITQVFPDEKDIDIFDIRNGILIWSLKGVNLPPKKLDSIGSIGYVSFKIRVGAGAKPGDTIHNKASIYFDYQKPVVTNKATIVFKKNSSIQQTEKYKLFNIYPNPACNYFNYDNTAHLKGNLQIMDITGKLILETILSDKGLVILPNDLNNGIYLIKIENDDTVLGKLIIIN